MRPASPSPTPCVQCSAVGCAPCCLPGSAQVSAAGCSSAAGPACPRLWLPGLPGGKDHKVQSQSLVACLQGGKDQKAEPPYGADVLRLWVASVDYTQDVVIGGRILTQVCS